MKVPVKKMVKAAENAFFNYERGVSVEEAWSALVDPNAGKFRRTQAAFAVIRSIVPDVVFEKLTGQHYKYHDDVLPIDPEKYV
ncbi:MAG: hypothetical protein QG581_205, partial [Patescibacteria group bacterium]|nr:hypothetical protein [Patescibacteria group bacterium]